MISTLGGLSFIRTKSKIVYLASPRGFCAGVKNAVETVERLLAEAGAPVYVRHEIVHNRHVIADLKKKGVVFVEDLKDVPRGSHVVFSAHGVSDAVESEAERRGLIVTDATCPIVKKIHARAAEYSRKDLTLLLIGHRNHPEIVGTSGRIRGRYFIVENVADVERLPPEIGEKIVCLTQTTLSADDVQEVFAAIRKKYGSRVVSYESNVCYATTERQDAVRKLAAKCGTVLVIGSKNSSNSLRLREISEKSGTRAFLIEDGRNVSAKMLEGSSSVGITAGASAPEKIVSGVLAKLARLGWMDVREEK